MPISNRFIALRHGFKSPWPYLSLVFGGFLSVCLYLTSTNEEFTLESYQIITCAVVIAVGFLVSWLRIPFLDRHLPKIAWLVFPVLSISAFLQMETSITNTYADLKWYGYVWSFLIALSFFLFIYAICGRIWLSGVIGSVIFFVWALVSYFTLYFRGTPLAPSDIFSAGTALEVLGGYTIPLSGELVMIASLFYFSLYLSLAARFPKSGRRRWLHWTLRAVSAAAAALWIWLGGFSSLPNAVGIDMSEWDWHLAYHGNSYLCTTLLKLNTLRVTPPAGYSDAETQQLFEEMDQPSASVSTSTPNVILIINESWFDWRQVTPFTTDREVTPFMDSMENCVRGYAVNPLVGTCASEYEILTSNSMSLFPSQIPFTTMNLSSCNSIVHHLSSLGYSSVAYHPCPGQNYNRVSAYPALGFEKSYFADSDDIEYPEFENVHIGTSDASCFEVVEMLYEQRDTSQPAFIYNLTFQNHGGYLIADVNGGWWATDPERWVNVTSGFDNVRPEAEEYLTCLTYTDEAVQQLVEYFSQEEEPTVICMVGDHPPYFSETVTSYGWEDSMEEQTYRRGTPFFIWANYPIEEKDVGYIGMPQLAPLLLETAGIELSPYYQSILELNEDVPTLGSYFYGTSDGTFHSYADTDISTIPTLRRYLYFEYNNVAHSAKRVDSLFLPYSLAG